MCQKCNKRLAVISETGETEDQEWHTLCFPCFRERMGHARSPQSAIEVEDRVDLHVRPVPSASIENRDQLYSDIRLRLRRAQIAARHACDEQPASLETVPEPAPLEKAS